MGEMVPMDKKAEDNRRCQTLLHLVGSVLSDLFLRYPQRKSCCSSLLHWSWCGLHFSTRDCYVMGVCRHLLGTDFSRMLIWRILGGFLAITGHSLLPCGQIWQYPAYSDLDKISLMLRIREGRSKDQCNRLCFLNFSLETTYFRFIETCWLNILIPGPYLRLTKFTEVGTKNKFLTSSNPNLEDFNYNSVFLIVLYYFY